MKKYNSNSVIVITILFFSFVLLAMPGAITSVGWPDIRDEFGLRQDSIGWLLMMSTVGHLISGAFNGRLMYLFGGGRAILIALGVYSLTLFGYWLTPSWAIMIALGLVSGWAAGTIDATANTIVAARYNDRIMNWLHGFFGVGATLGPLVISLVVAAGSDWRGGAFVFGLLLLMMFGVVLVLRPIGNNKSLQADGNEASEESSAPSLETLSNFSVWIAILFFFFYGGVEVAIGQWSFTIFTESRGLSPELARLWVSIYWGTFTIGRFVFGLISHWMPVNRWLRSCLIATLLSVILLLFPNRPVLGVLGLGLSGLAQAPIFATLISNMPKLVGRKHTSNAIGYVVGAAGIGLAILPWIAGILAERFTLEAIPPYVLLMSLVLLGLFELLVRTDQGNKVVVPVQITSTDSL